ncbi:unnamed protein product, partial [Mesorhabditis belari]|uniref:Uncharacterized protein n=1 Tax=Mesorhabditis belari TaxID=2138241 RepID=A0AAF3J9X8_9BILA
MEIGQRRSSDSSDERLAAVKRMRLSDYSAGATNVTFQQHKIGREERAQIMGKHPGFRGCTIWFTGLSGAGKTTVAFALEKALTQLGLPCYGLDGDNVRHGLCRNLGFNMGDRSENIRRVAEVAKLMADAGMVCLASFISPFRADRDQARKIHDAEGLRFIEVYVNTPLEICETRDPKKLYKKARAGELPGFTGIDSAYEPPETPDLLVQTENRSEAETVHQVLHYLYDLGILPQKAMDELMTSPVRELIVNDVSIRSTLNTQAQALAKVELQHIDVEWLQVLSEGWGTPLGGFMRERQYLQALHFGQLLDLKHKCAFPGDNDDGAQDPYPMLDSVNQSIPIVLPITLEQKQTITAADGTILPEVALVYKGKVLAILKEGEVFDHRKEERVCRQFGCADARHPTIDLIKKSGDFCLGGDLQVLERITYNDGLDSYRRTPNELRQIFDQKGADAVFVFQLRNPIHNGHALLMRDTREKLLKKYKNPMLLLHPLGGWTKDDDVPLPVRIEQHQAVIEEGILDPAWTVLSIFPSPMLYAGPTEVQWHARARIAAGVHTYIVGRDPAGIQNPENGDFLYHPEHGAKVLSMAPGLSHLSILPFRVAAYDKSVGRMAFFDPKRKEEFEFISGTKMRGLARSGQTPPDGFMAPKAWTVLASYYKKLAQQNGHQNGVAK